MRSRIVAVAVAFAVGASGCGAGGSESARTGEDAADPTAPEGGTPIEVEQIPGGPREKVPSALDNRTNDAFPAALVDVDEIRSGGPPPDGIPPVDEPRFVRPASVQTLDDQEPVIAFTLDGDARATPSRSSPGTRS